MHFWKTTGWCKINSDYDLPLQETLKLHSMVMYNRPVIENGNKYCP